ncbi:MAG TPA: hypothetical protein VD994_11120 [Prosthecobacter sp.]|nr:hypothetical protein [Prosthecobacter sp.]
MDHSYRAVNGEANGNANFNGNRARGVMFHQPSPFDDVEHTPQPVQANGVSAPPRIYAFIEELFFFAKIQEISKKLNIKVEFVKSEKEVAQKVEESGEQPSLIIFDLNNANAKPLVTIPKLRKEFKKGTSILGFVSHVQGDLKVKAQEAGCDVVMPRSAFSQNLVGLLRRHGLPDEEGME